MTRMRLYIILGIAVVVIMAAVLSLGGVRGGFVRDYASNDVSRLPKAAPPGIVELKNGDTYDLVASYVQKEIDGVPYRMLAYNGSIPGPLIKVSQGAEITIRFTNDTDMETLLHSHGVRMDNAFDGSQTTQNNMRPGERFSYTLKFPDAGMYWYHPHVREDFEQELGLYGNYLVVPENGDYWSSVNREEALFLDDILIENSAISLSKRVAGRTLMGRFGNVMLVNGETRYALSVRRGEVVRFYITNTANARPFNVAIPGVQMKLVGADGGAYEKDARVDSVLLGPSERAIVEVLFGASGSFVIQNKTPGKVYELGTVVVSDEPADASYADSFGRLRVHDEIARSIEPFRKYAAAPPDKSIALSLDMGPGLMGMQSSGGHMMPDGGMMRMPMTGAGESGIEWEDTAPMMNLLSNAASAQWNITDRVTGKKNMDIDWTFARGTPVKIRIINDAHSPHPMQHPIHFHGQRFLVVSRDGVPQLNLVWKDTAMVKAGETVDIILNPSNPGTWMAHCHIAEHLEAGMMTKFVVE